MILFTLFVNSWILCLPLITWFLKLVLTLVYQFNLQVTWIVFNIVTMEDVLPTKTNLFVCAILAIAETIVPN